jgi:methyltransferase-like protein/SAM-dependent methyltransferase
MIANNIRRSPGAGPAEAPASDETGVSSYDECPYDSYPYHQTHPDRLATVATLFGMKPPPIDGCRVLELGCASGGNLIPMALTLPASRFVGIDLSSRQIADGRKVVAELGLDNIDLRHLSILDVDQDFGRFDYIICHGVFSWVPSAVQDRILEICARNLAPQGVAFVSYNTYPGWHMSGMIRDMLRFHARRFAQPQKRAEQARALLNFLAATVAHEPSAYNSLLKEGLEVFRRVNNSYLLHEYLEEVNEPIYFHQFVERVAGHGLQYLAEAEVHAMVPGRFGPDVAATLEKLSSDFIEMEQFLDFVRNRKFRQTLLCHREVPLDRKVGPETLSEMYVASALQPASANLDIGSSAPAAFRSPQGRTPTTTDPLLKAALVHLAEHWPQAVSFAGLSGAARARLGWAASADPARDRQILGKSLLQLYSANLVELHIRELPFVRQVPDRPLASPLARLQAASGPAVTNLRHESVSLGDLDRQVLRCLDGRHNRATLLEQLGDFLCASGKVSGTRSAALDQCLARLANGPLFVG